MVAYMEPLGKDSLDGALKTILLSGLHGLSDALLRHVTGFNVPRVHGRPAAVLVLDSQWENFKLFGLIYSVYPKKFELFWAWLLKKRVVF